MSYITSHNARANLPGSARGRAVGIGDARRGRVATRRRRRAHLRRARTPRGARWAAVIEALGVRAGDHVATLLPNTFDSHRALLALGWLRVVEVPLNTAYVGRMLAYTVDHSDATTLLTTSEYVDRVDRRAGPTCPSWSESWSSTPTTSSPAARDVSHESDVAGAGVPRHPLAHVHVGHDRAVEGGDHAVGGDVPVLVVGARRRARGGRGRVLHDADVPQLGALRVQLRRSCAARASSPATASAPPRSGTTCAPPTAAPPRSSGR